MKHGLKATLVTIGLVFGNSAHAAMLTFQFEGTLTFVSDASGHLDGRVQVGSSFHGSYTFDSLAVDQHADPSIGVYATASAINLQVGDLVISAPGPAQILVLNNHVGIDAYSVGSVGFPSGELYVTEMSLLLRDQTGQAFSSDALPLEPPDLDSFSTRLLMIEGYRSDLPDQFSIHGTITAITPEPTSLLLIVAGCFLVSQRRAGTRVKSVLWASVSFSGR